MPPIPTCRCPSCGVLNALTESICLRCLGPLPACIPMAPATAVTGETIRMCRAPATAALLLLGPLAVEYAAAEVAFTTTLTNVATITYTAEDDILCLYQTRQQISLRGANNRAWLSQRSRSIPLRQFGYPTNRQLVADLNRSAPQLGRASDAAVRRRS